MTSSFDLAGAAATAATAGAVVCTGLSAGLLYSFAHTVMPGLTSLGDRAYLTAFWRMDSVVTNGWMLLAWVGSPVLVLVALVLRVADRDAAFGWLVVTAVLVLATWVVTAAVHLPLNSAVQHAAPDFADAAALRERFETTWVRWNVVRTVTAVAATVTSILALLGRPD